MSRARLFKRAANWLKNCIKTKEQAEEAKDRQRAFRFAFGQLEERVVLDADFAFDGANLVMNNYSSLGAEALEVSETATVYEFTLNEGVWNGSDTGLVYGDGTNTLTVHKNAGGGGSGLSLDLIGTPGSDVVGYTAYGSVTVTAAALNTSSGLGLAPVFGGGFWTSSFDNNLGDILRDGMDTSFNDDLLLSNGGISYRNNGIEFGVLDTIDLDGSSTGGGDDIELDTTVTINYPTLGIGDIVSWTGSGTFTLEDGETFDSLFTNGTFSNAIDGGDYTVNVFNTGSSGVQTITSNGAGIDVNFGDVDFNAPGTITSIDFTGGDITQTGALTADLVGDVSITGDNISLRHAGNDFDSLTLDAAVIEIADSNDLTILDAIASTALSLETGGNLALNNDINVPTVHLNAGDGVDQLASTFLSADQLLLQGTGDFNLIESNRIGDAFSDGLLAADIDGSLTLNNNFDLVIDDLTFNFMDASSANITGVQIDAGSSTGNFMVTTSQDDVSQTGAGKVVVAGLASFDVGVGCVGLATSLDNDFNEVEILMADEAEVVDGIDGMTLLGSNIEDQALFGTAGELSIKETINAGARLFVLSSGGATQQINSVINARELLVFGNGDFSFEQENNIQNLGGIGQIAVDVAGNFALENTVATRVDTLDYTTKDGLPFNIQGINVTGDFEMILPDFDFDQESDSPFIVGGTSTFDLGLGCLDLSYADGDSDFANDNNFNSIAIDSASLVDVVDMDGFEIDDSVISDRARFESESGTIVIDRDLRVANRILFVSADGMAQNVGANIETPEVLFYGTGDFVLDQLNSIGNSSTPADVAAMIDGSLELKNGFGINVASLSYENKDTSTVDIVGINMDNTTGSGDLKFDANNADVTQNADSPIISTGLTTFDVGTTGTVNLPFADSMPDLDLINENDFNEIAVDNGDTVEVNDINTIIVAGAFTNSRLSVTSDTADIILNGNVNVASVVKLDAQTGLAQTGGVIDAQSLLVFGQGYFDFSQLNSLGNGIAGVIAADVNGDISLTNSNRMQVGSVGYTDLNGNAFSAFGIGSTLQFGGVDNFRLRADGIELWQRTVADTVVFETTDGISQQDTQTTDGLIDADDLSLIGSGFGNLTENNLIGSNLGQGDVAIDWSGDLRLKSLFGIDFDDVTFTFKSGATRVDEGISVAQSGGTLGSFELFAGGDITDDADIHIDIAGIGSFIADNGNADIVIGDAFSTTGGPNNDTHFGSVGFKARNASVAEDSAMHLDGVSLAGNLEVSAFGSIIQTGSDPFSNVGTSAIEVKGSADFIVDNDTLPTDHLNDTVGRDVLLMSRDNDELIDNLFEGPVTISGTFNTGDLNGVGTLRNVKFRNSAFEVSAFPSIDQTADPLRSLTVWVPRSSANLSQDINVLSNFIVYAGVDSVNGKTGASLAVTNALLNRKITDSSNTDIFVGGNAVFETGNTIILANNSTNSLVVGGKLQTSTHGGDAGSRIRVGVAGSVRGSDSGALVDVDQLRFRAKPTTQDNSEHATFNIDSPVEITGPNVARSLMLIADGDITDDSDADINVKFSTTLVAENSNDILLGEDFSTNFIDNNVHNFGSLSMRARNADVTEDSAIQLDGINLTGNLSITAMGHIRQLGQDRFGQIGTDVIQVAGDATFRVDQQQLPLDQLNDTIGQDIRLMATPQQRLMDNVINGEVIVTSTAFDNSNNGKGSVRNVEIRNTSTSAKDPIFQLAGADKVRNLHLWITENNLVLRDDISVTNNFRAFVGVDSVNGLRNGRLQIINNSISLGMGDTATVKVDVGRDLDFRVSNYIVLANDLNNSIQVGNKSTFITLGGSQGNGISVGANGLVDSGAIFETNILKYRAPVMGNFGEVVIIGDQPMNVTADSMAKTALILP